MNGHPTQAWYRAILPQWMFIDELNNLDKKADAVLEECFISDVRGSHCSEISYGQKKLLNLACCIANDADLLLLDEPIAGISPGYRDKIRVLLKRLQADGKTIFLIEHNTEFLQTVADCFFFLRSGGLRSYASFGELRDDKAVLDAYLTA
jgi:branched-chain amino acid transport system ATP-binding protein